MKIYVAGHSGMVGSAIVRELQRAIPDATIIKRTHAELNLLNQARVYEFLKIEKPDYLFIAAAKVGGIYANNTYRAQFLYENLMIVCNLIHSAYQSGIRNLMFLGSSCAYPSNCPQPIKEEYLLTGSLEQTNEPYALAKIAGIKLCETYNQQYQTNYISLMPTNLYGPGDNYNVECSHVLPALIRRAHECKVEGEKKLLVWGSGTPKREFLYVDDLAAACVYFMHKSLYEYSEPLPLLNIGTGKELTIAALAQLVMEVVGIEAELAFDSNKPDGTLRKLLDTSQATALGWTARVELKQGINNAYQDFTASIGRYL